MNLRVIIAFAFAMSACGSRAHHVELEHANKPPLKAAPQPSDPAAEPQPEPAPGTPEQDFVLSDEPEANPAQLLEATKHDCCDEASTDEINAGIRDQPATRKKSPQQR